MTCPDVMGLTPPFLARNRARPEPDAGHPLALRRRSLAREILTTEAVDDARPAQENAMRPRVAREIAVNRCVSIA